MHRDEWRCLDLLVSDIFSAPPAVLNFRKEKKFKKKKNSFGDRKETLDRAGCFPGTRLHFVIVIIIIINDKLMLLSREGSVSLSRQGASTRIPHRQSCSVPKTIPGIEGARKKPGTILGCHSTGTGRAGTSGRTFWDHLSAGHLIKGTSLNPFLSSKANPAALSTFPENSGPKQRYFHGIWKHS